MKLQTELPLSRQISSNASVVLVSVFSGLVVFFLAILLQWLIYNDWLHRNGPLRLVGSAVAFFLTSLFAYRWQLAKRAEKIEVLKRIEAIQWMNDRIRNSLQAIECVVYATNPHVTDPVRDAVDSIEDVLQEMLSEMPAAAHRRRESLTESRTPKTTI